MAKFDAAADRQGVVRVDPIDAVPDGVDVPDPTVGRPAPPPEPEVTAGRRPVRRTFKVSTVKWDEENLAWLRVQCAREPGLFRQAIVNVLVNRLRAGTRAEQRAVFDEALAWEREARP